MAGNEGKRGSGQFHPWRWAAFGAVLAVAACAVLGYAGVWKSEYRAQPLDNAIVITLGWGPCCAPFGALAAVAAGYWTRRGAESRGRVG